MFARDRCEHRSASGRVQGECSRTPRGLAARAGGRAGRCDALLLFNVQVKADKDSGNLHRLQQASRGVTQATAKLVASTKSGKSQIEETGEADCNKKLLPLLLQKTNQLTFASVCFRHDGLLQHDADPDQTAGDGCTGQDRARHRL